MEKKMKKKNSKTVACDIKKKANLFLENTKNANNLIDILASSESSDDTTVLACVHSFHKVFLHLLSSEEMYLEKIPDSDEGLDKAGKFRFWLLSRYNDCCGRLFELLASENTNVKELSLCTLMKFIETEGRHPIRKLDGSHLAFPQTLFQSVLKALLHSTLDQTQLIARFQEFLTYDDVRYNAMKMCQRRIKQNEGEGGTEVFHRNVLALLENLSMPAAAAEEGDRLTNFLTRAPEGEKNFKINTYKEHKKLFTSLWLDFLKAKLSTKLYRQVLVLLHEKVMPYMTSPLQLTDFLMQSYNIGGAISLLALNGLFILITKYNLDEPQFFPKLYALLDHGVFYAKYRARFFYLLDIFLGSTHLPASLVAAFIKKLARISLMAPCEGVRIIVHMIQNLLIRHPSCKTLVQRPDGPSNESEDPFDMEERDPAKCRALDSSLWELKTMESHYFHHVSRDVKVMLENLPKHEEDMADLFDMTAAKMFHMDKKKKYQESPVNFYPPKGVFGNREDQFSDLWTLA